MASEHCKIDLRQGVLDFESRLDSYVEAREEMIEACRQPDTPARPYETAGDACEEIAVAVKRAIRQTGLSREEVVDRINEYFGHKRISYHMMNHYLSKPEKYPLPAFLIPALTHITSSLDIIQTIAEPAGARVISREEVKMMNLGKLDQMVSEMQKLKRELKNR